MTTVPTTKNVLRVVVAAEYIRRVRTRAFLLTTLLGPLALAAVGGGAVYVVAFSVADDSERERRLAVLDPTGRFPERLRSEARAGYRILEAASLESGKRTVLGGDADVFLVLPTQSPAPDEPWTATAYLAQTQSVGFERYLRQLLRDVARDVRLDGMGLAPEALAAAREPLSLSTVTLGSEEMRPYSGEMPFVVGLGVALATLMVMAVYGGLVMQAAMEEKTSRMAEILVATVRPFELLMGKILAVAGVAATQFLVWGAMLVAGAATVALVIPAEALSELGVGDADGNFGLPAFTAPFSVIGVVAIALPLGYLINAALFGAIGALYESSQEAQLAVSIAMAPLVATVLVVQIARLAPDSPVIVFGSFFPFTAPAMLPARMLLTDVPGWQVATSLLLCASTAVGIVWLAGRIFRGSLLAYGRKPRFRDVWRTLRSD